MELIRLVAPAKLTVSLSVHGRRPDGYHDLTAEMVTVDLYDTLFLDPDGDGIEVHAAPETAANLRLGSLDGGPTNLVARALAAVRRTARVRLVKRIPPGGGLGGGSSDAAAILRWAGCADPGVAASLGADVPFCLAGGRALVRGIGEEVSPLPFVDRSFLLLHPPLSVDTAAVYRAWDDMATPKGPGSGEPGPDDPGSGDPGNDLTAPALVVEPDLARWRDLLGERTGTEPRLAGSGSTWFVEGTPASLGLDTTTSLSSGGDTAHLTAVRTVPAGWEPGRD